MRSPTWIVLAVGTLACTPPPDAPTPDTPTAPVARAEHALEGAPCDAADLEPILACWAERCAGVVDPLDQNLCVWSSCGEFFAPLDPVCVDCLRSLDLLLGPAARAAICTGEPFCGDGIVQDGEKCDDGPMNADDRPDACRTTCTLAACGDGVVDRGESCDEGRTPSCHRNDCLPTCRIPGCGNGRLQPSLGETCDDGNTLSGDGCRANCQVEVCGDGILDPGEECEPDLSWDCLADCTYPRPEDCTNGEDDDRDGLVDCDDPDCRWRWECVERLDPLTCPDQDLGDFVGTIEGDTRAATNDMRVPCLGAGVARDVAYAWTAPGAGTWAFDTAGSPYDTALFALTGCEGAVLACNDDWYGLQSHLELDLEAGQSIVLVVSGYGDASGPYQLTIAPFEACENGRDDDGDGLVDCDDPACQLHPACWRPEICDNGVDDNGNGLTDCDDPDCRGTPMCWVEEICDNGVDDNDNGATDCEEATCFGAHPACIEICDNGLDDNRDGLADCDDPLCMFQPPCSGPEVCFDDNGDGQVTCEDRSCMASDPACWPQGEICGDGLDNDGNGLWDCDDPACWGTPDCGPPPVGEDCLDGLDNDGNGLVDCEDPACVWWPHCQDVGERCGDGWDNDGNGLADCADPACAGLPECATDEVCGDGWDNDGDGLADCRDPACLDVCGGLSCRELNDCLGGCADGEPACGDLCFARATPEAAATFEAAIACLEATGGDYTACRAEIDACLGVEICDNGVDDEPDGYADCDDMDCRAAPGCEPGGSMSCAQLNECLGQCPGDDQRCLTSCFRESTPAAVAAFEAAIACIEANGGAYEPCMDLVEACLFAREVCDDGLDNNGDGLVDCEDPGCWQAPACFVPEVCDNGVDDDGNGATDCDDAACAGDPACPVDCIAMRPVTGDRTGWAAWSEVQADAARQRYVWHGERLARQQREHDARMAARASARLTALQVPRGAGDA
ncbi:MAG: hypothetical protein KC549_10060 [Myxococcales bacterium]|nr:hypothetical protein [Myxococcales bacterium]